MKLLSSVFPSVFKRRDVNILLGFMILPIVTPVLTGVSDQQTSQDIYASFFNFFAGAIETQYQLVLPALIIGFIVSSVFRDEINSGQLFLYKDLKRASIFNAKLMSLYAVYGIYWVGTFLATFATYVIYAAPKTGFHFLPTSQADRLILQLLTITALHFILITLVAAVSIKRSTLAAVLTGALFNIVAQTAPLLNGFRYVFPNTYPRLLGRLNFGAALAISLGISLLYLGLSYGSARKHFNRIEY
ncbi:hypothetical protein ACVRYP_08570 [Streptococcus rifensis]